MSVGIEISSEMDNRLRKVGSEVSDLVFSLITLLAPLSERHYSTKVPDYRFFKKYVFCVLNPMINNPVVRVDLRPDNVLMYSKLLELHEINMITSGRPGTRWIYFDVGASDAQVDEAVRLVTTVAYENKELAS